MFEDIDLVLMSRSPRRRQLLEDAGFHFRALESTAKEICPPVLHREEIPVFLSNIKAESFPETCGPKTLIIGADTIVWAGGKALGKPASKEEAADMLRLLAGNVHEVITGVTLKSRYCKRTFYNVTRVAFTELSPKEIVHYIDNYHPFDKAGAYGIQEWIGLIGVKGIEGCFYNVMGLPVSQLYYEINRWEFR